MANNNDTFEMLDPSPKGGKGLIIAIAAIVIIGLGIGGYFLFKKNPEMTVVADPTKIATQSALTPSTTQFTDNIIVNSRVEPVAVRFNFDSIELLAPESDKISRFWSQVKDLDGTIHVWGHTDSTGSPEYNLNLSQQRADRVAEVLKGMGAQNLDSKGFGAKQPVAANDTEAGRAQNRRVELNLNGE